MRILLDDEKLGKLKGKMTGRYFIPDKAPGLYVCIHPTGKLVWTFIQRLKAENGPDGKKTPGKLFKKALGIYPVMSAPEAREEAKRYFKTYEAGGDPADLVKNEAASREMDRGETVGKIGELWLENDQKENRSYLKVRQFFEHRVLPVWGSRPISSITKSDVQNYLLEYAKETSKDRSDRVRSWLISLFEWAVDFKNLPANPAAMTKKLTTPKERERCLDDRELVEVWRASDFLDQDPQGEFRKRRNQYNPTGPTWSPIIKLLILLGARRAEISELRWSEVKLREGLLQLPGSRTKRLPGHTNEERIIYLSRQAREILQAMPRRIGCDFVFPNSDGSAAVKGGWGRATLRLKKLVERARVEKGIKEAMPDFWVHDFRRVLVTGLQRLGIPIEVTETILGHISGSRAGIVKVYHKYGFKKEARAAVQKWADRVECFLAGKFDKDEDVEQEKIS